MPPIVSERGLTLVEMLVVLAIIGVVTAATLLSFAPSHHGSVKVEAQQLAAAIGSAADAAMVDDSEVAIVAGSDSYHFTGVDQARHTLPAGIILTGASPSQPLLLSTANNIELKLTHGSDRWVVIFDGIRAHAMPLEPRR